MAGKGGFAQAVVEASNKPSYYSGMVVVDDEKAKVIIQAFNRGGSQVALYQAILDIGGHTKAWQFVRAEGVRFNAGAAAFEPCEVKDLPQEVQRELRQAYGRALHFFERAGGPTHPRLVVDY